MDDTSWSRWPFYSLNEQEVCMSILQSGQVNYWTGKKGRQFEAEFAQYHRLPYAVALSNGTIALELALIGLGVGKGDEVIVTPRTFIASASSIIRCGAIPVFADVEVDSQNISANTVLPKISAKTKAIICVHLAGWPCEMKALQELASEYGIFLIEDCAQAHGAKYHNQLVGGLSDIGAFSFCQDKIISTGGEGGMIVTRQKGIYENIWSLKDHGKNKCHLDTLQQHLYENEKKPSHQASTKSQGKGYQFVHDIWGTNGRMTEFQSAIGIYQLGQLDQWLERRRKIAKLLTRACDESGIFSVAKPPSYIEHAYYRFYAFINNQRLKSSWSRDRVMAAIREEGIPCSMGICPDIRKEKAMKDYVIYPYERLQNTSWLEQHAIMFPIHPFLLDDDIEKAMDVLVSLGKKAIKTSAALSEL